MDIYIQDANWHEFVIQFVFTNYQKIVNNCKDKPLVTFSDTVHFDNTYSWMTSKQISYVLDVIKPSEQIKRAEEAKQQNVHDAYGAEL